MTRRVRFIKKTRPPKPGGAYQQLWRIVEGAVRDALQMHPEYIANDKRARDVVNSITKRVAGSVLGFASLADTKHLDKKGSAEGPFGG